MPTRRLGRVVASACVTLAAIPVLPATASAAFGDRTLARGSAGHDVRVLQSWLGRLGHPTGVDGHFGAGTARAVRGYERREGLRRDGRVTRQQARRMRRTIESGATTRAAAPAPIATPTATLAPDGRTAIAPAGAPPAVVAAIAAANAITRRPYRYGGGHGSFEDSGYDCSGAVSYALHGAGLLKAPLASGALRSFGKAGRGRWITVYAHGGHAYAVIAGVRFDTSGAGEKGPRWRPAPRSAQGFTVRHPAGL